MDKKEVIILSSFLFLILLSVIAHAENVSFNEPSPEDLPKSVREALGKYVEQMRQLELAKERRDRVIGIGMDSILIATAIVLGIFFVWKWRSWYHKLRRSFRRRRMYKKIDVLVQKGATFSEVRQKLIKQGYTKKHAYDAVHWYKKKSQGEDGRYHYSLIDKIPIYRRIRRKIRRWVLFSRIESLVRRGDSYSEVRRKLFAKGWKERHVNDAVHRYKKIYWEKRR